MQSRNWRATFSTTSFRACRRAYGSRVFAAMAGSSATMISRSVLRAGVRTAGARAWVARRQGSVLAGFAGQSDHPDPGGGRQWCCRGAVGVAQALGNQCLQRVGGLGG